MKKIAVLLLTALLALAAGAATAEKEKPAALPSAETAWLELESIPGRGRTVCGEFPGAGNGYGADHRIQGGDSPGGNHSCPDGCQTDHTGDPGGG